jgi:hypothetical protein
MGKTSIHMKPSSWANRAGPAAGAIRPGLNGSSGELARIAESLAEAPGKAVAARQVTSVAGKLPFVGLAFGGVATAVAIDHFERDNNAQRVAALSTTASTAAQAVGIAGKALTLERAASVGRVGTPLLTAVAQGVTAANEVHKKQVYNGVTSATLALGAALLAVPGAQAVGLALVGGSLVAKLAKRPIEGIGHWFTHLV